MKTDAEILNNMNEKVKQLEQDVQKLENSFGKQKASFSI
jgi:hypothetical protein